mgnify:FL=1|jgi:hypothetical protein|tara:strand:- start:498 stop:776 length:279 start_codon:yes stop_codon:yes gene_type:complete
MKKQETTYELGIGGVIFIALLMVAGITTVDYFAQQEVTSLQHQLNETRTNISQNLYQAAITCTPIQMLGDQGAVVLYDPRCWELLKQQQGDV